MAKKATLGPPARILIVDDHQAVRECLALHLSGHPDLEVCAQAGEVAEAIHKAQDTRPDLAIVDLSLKDGHGLELIKRLKAHHPEIKILVWSMHPESLYAERVFHAGAAGYVNKEHATEEITSAIHKVLNGETYLSESAARFLPRVAVGGISPLDGLSDRELETFELLGQGMNTQQIANRLHLSPKTVETYRGRIKQKLHLDNGTELMQRAIQWVMEKK